jgi:hypothetical protein
MPLHVFPFGLSEDRFKPRDVLLRLSEMLFEARFQVGRRCCLCHLRQRLYQLIFRAIQIAQFV